MKVLFIRLFESYFDRTVPEGMKRLGWEVDEEEFFTPQDQTNDPRLQQLVHDRLEKMSGGWDFCFTVNFWPVLAPVLDDLGIRYVSWSYDAPLNFTGTPEMERKNNYIFLFDRGQVRDYQKQGVSRVWHLPLATDPEIFSGEIKKNREKYNDCGVSFIGSFYYSPYTSVVSQIGDHLKGYLDGILEAQRNLIGGYILPELITDDIISQVNADLEKNNTKEADIFAGNVTARNLIYAMATRITCLDRLTLLTVASELTGTYVYTSNKPEELASVLHRVQINGPVDYFTEMPVIFNRSRINLCPTLRCITTGIPLRAIDIMACHGVVLMPLSEENAEYMSNGTDSLLYSSYDEAYELMKFYLANDDLLEKIRDNAYEKARRDFTMEERLRNIERTIHDN
ncbi:MAG: DUF3880 domain-containing protein [Lachnospiraceae bacterium]|nr:DUF3880 domain-containing protein [Lachnospiraceae bacterium]